MKFHCFFLDVSVCATQHYDIDYGYEGNRVCEKEALEAAAHLTKEQNSINQLLEALPTNAEDECLQNAAMSISNLLNPARKFITFPMKLYRRVKH